MASDFTGRIRGSLGRVEPGSRIAGYLIEEQIGAGGMGAVFRTRDEVLGRLAAVKIIAPSAVDDEEFRARFLRESRLAAAVDSPHIIPVYGAGESEGLLYIATRFVPGGDLEALRRRSGGRLSPARVAALVTQVASALDSAHGAGLVHRDVKPQNVLVDSMPGQAEHAFLSDFGLSKGTGSTTELTATGYFVGTPGFCAPEQIRDVPLDGRADQYALGCVAFVLLTGELLFRRTDPMALLYAHVHDPAPSLSRLRADLPASVDSVIARAVAKAPADRYARCGDFAEALRQALLSPRSATVPARPPGQAVTTVHGNGGAGSPRRPDAVVGPGRASGRRRGRTAVIGRKRAALIGGAAALVFAVAGTMYSTGLPGGSRAAAAHSSLPVPRRPVMPVLAARLTIPGGDGVGRIWFSGDGKLVAGLGAHRPAVYVWNTASPHHVQTLALPPGATFDAALSYPLAVLNVAFNASGTSLTMSFISGHSVQNPATVIVMVYQWNLATGKLATSPWELGTNTPGVLVSGDNSKALLYNDKGNHVRLATIGSAATTSLGTPFLLLGPVPVLDAGSSSMDNDGTRLLYDGGYSIHYVLDFTTGKIVATLPFDSLSTSLSGNGLAVLERPGHSTSSKGYPPPVLWDVATGSVITPTDPRWSQQESQRPDQAGFSADGSIIETVRSGGQVDLWDVATRKYLTTVTDPAVTNDPYGAFVGPGGGEVAIIGDDASHQVSLWRTALGSPKPAGA